MVSNGSSITSPAELSSRCCCSTEYLCTKNLPAHSESSQIIGKMVACRQAEYTSCIHVLRHTDLPPQTYFLTNITPETMLSSKTIMTVVTMKGVLEEGFFTCENSKNKTNLQQLKKDKTDCRLFCISHNIFMSCMRY